nr:MAG TPA: hypothetical protein [Caudoviricetes sp.]
MKGNFLNCSFYRRLRLAVFLVPILVPKSNLYVTFLDITNFKNVDLTRL